MPGSLLRKKRPHRAPSRAASGGGASLHPSLSLPDLTSPLLDPASWEEVPQFSGYPPGADPPLLTTGPYPARSPGAEPGSGTTAGRGLGPGPGFGTGEDPDHGHGHGRGVTVAPAPGSSTGTRHRAPSLITKANEGPGSPVQFHRPFTPWQVVKSPRPSPNDIASPAATGVWAGGGGGGVRGVEGSWATRGAEGPWGGRVPPDVLTSQARWGSARDSVITQPAGSVTGAHVEHRGWRSRRRGKSRVAQALNVVVVGGKGVGKTSFIRLLLDSLRQPSVSPELADGVPTINGDVASPGTYAASVPLPASPPGRCIEDNKSPTSLPGRSADDNKSPASPPRHAMDYSKSAAEDVIDPTTSVSAHVATVTHDLDKYDRTRLRLIDTPGLELGHGAVEATERERGVAGVLRLVEDRFEEMLREERKVVRRQGTSEDRVIHLILYLINASTVVRPRPTLDPTEVDWSGVGLFDDPPREWAGDAGVGACAVRLDPVEIQIIRRLSLRANILPVLTNVDALTTAELALVRETVRHELSHAFQSDSGSGSGIFGAVDAEDADGDLSTSEGGGGVPSDQRPPTPATTEQSHEGTLDLPFAIFSPDRGERYVRSFPWGTASVLDPKHSDLTALKDAILGDNAKTLRTTTREILYERYRTERLLARDERG